MSKRLLSGHEVEQVSEEMAKEIQMEAFANGLIRILPEGWIYPASAPTYLDQIQKMEFKADDVILMTFPKCGTTWMQEIIWTMLHNVNLDNPKADESIWLRSPEISSDMMFDVKTLGGSAPESYYKKIEEMSPGKRVQDGKGVNLMIAELMESPRVIKTHFPLCLMPQDLLDKCKIVYVARNPKDMVVSLFHYFEMLSVFPFDGEKEGYFKSAINNKMLFAPFWPHVKEAWEKRHHPNLHFVFFEDMKADIMAELRKVNEFLGTGLSEETLEGVARHTSFSAMKSRGEPLSDKIFSKDDENDVRFFRKGTTGDWKNHFSPELQKEADRWIKENVAGTDLSLSWALAN